MAQENCLIGCRTPKLTDSKGNVFKKENQSRLTNVFVYGTLMKRYRDPRSGKVVSHSRSKVLAPFQPLLGKLEGYRIIWPKGLNFPFAVEDPSSAVYGELYQVPEDVVRRLDEIEDVKGNLFEKKILKVRLESGQTVDAVVYVGGERLRKECGGAELCWSGDTLLPEAPNF